MFTIIGADHKEYGPVSAEEVRDWIAQGRADGRTLGRAEGTAEWKPLAAFPEFAGAGTAGGTPPRLTSPSPGYAPSYSDDPTAQILGTDPNFSIGDCISHGGSLVVNNFGLLAGASAMVWLMDFFLSAIPLIGAIFTGVIYGGLCLVFLKRIRGQETSSGETFSGFTQAFAQLALTGFLMSLLSTVGMCLCVVPGIYLKIAWVFALPLVIDKRLEFWTAMELSRKVATRVWFKAFALVIIALAPFLTTSLYAVHKQQQLWNAQIWPVVSAAHLDFSNIADLVQKLGGLVQKLEPVFVEIQRSMFYLNLTTQLVLLVNLPFAVAVILYAYESLFGTGKTRSA